MNKWYFDSVLPYLFFGPDEFWAFSSPFLALKLARRRSISLGALNGPGVGLYGGGLARPGSAPAAGGGC